MIALHVPVILLVVMMAVMIPTRRVVAMVTVPAGHWSQPGQQNTGGAGVGRLIMEEIQDYETKWQCHYDMVLVERLQKSKRGADDELSDGALFVPDDAQVPRLSLCRVLTLGAGREEENGTIAPDVNQLTVGDLVLAKNPWGIGPKDEELSDGSKVSFMRMIDIAAKVTGTLA